MAVDHYELLGVRPDADQTTIRTAYLAMMRATHPDRRPGDVTAAERARLANAAWHALSDPVRRAAYDRASRRQYVFSRPEHKASSARVSSAERFREAFHLATLKAGAVIVAVGLVLLLALGGG
jgi:curved DNA-binding protein CbpA